jgi:magnesium transporter
MVDIRHFHQGIASSLTREELLRMSASSLADDAMVWINLASPTPEEEHDILATFFPVHELVLSDARRALGAHEDDDGQFHHPKVDDFGSYLFIIMHAIVQRSASGDSQDAADALRGLSESQINIVVGERVLITHHANDIPAVSGLVNACDRNPHLLSRGPDYLLHILLDDLVDAYVPIAVQFEDRVDELEHAIFRRPSNLVLVRILELKRLMQRIRKDVVYQREIVNRLARGEFALISLHESMYYRNVYDHLVRIADQIESSRDLTISIMEAYFSVSSARLNEVMKVLTVISTIFLPITFLTSLYGMNFEFMPELHWTWAYPAVLSIIVVVAGSMYYMFRRRGWLD